MKIFLPAASNKRAHNGSNLEIISSFKHSFSSFYDNVLVKVHPFWVQLFYFISLSVLGFILLILFHERSSGGRRPGHFDVFFTSVSASTVSSMTAVEMETFSNPQLLILTLLMLLGGEIFTSFLALQLKKLNFTRYERTPSNQQPSLELNATNHVDIETCNRNEITSKIDLKENSMRFLGYVVLGHLIVAHASGFAMILVYLSSFASAKSVLTSKSIRAPTFSIFTTVSSFSNCGFVPTNENMIVFRSFSGLLVVVVVLVLIGNTLYPACLRLELWLMKKVTKRKEFEYASVNWRELEYGHLFSSTNTALLAFTVLGFVIVQVILFCCMEWNSDVLAGATGIQKIVGALFQSVNARHAGETVVDLATLSPAILVLFVVMMYLPPYTCFMPCEEHKEEEGDANKRRRRSKFVEKLSFSQLSHLAIFIIIICVTERKQLSEDPINFNVLNITLEVISAYGNVGFSTGYSCKRRLKADPNCKDSWVGFSGRWSSKGKFMIIIVMFLGRLKNVTKLEN